MIPMSGCHSNHPTIGFKTFILHFAPGEAKQAFSALKEVKTSLSNTMSKDRLDALAILAREQQLIKGILIKLLIKEQLNNLQDRKNIGLST